MRPVPLLVALSAVIAITTALVLAGANSEAKSAVPHSTVTPVAAAAKSTSTTPKPTPTAQAPMPPPSAVAQQVQQAVQAVVPGASVGLLVVDTSTATTVTSLNANQQFYSASVVKLLIALDAINSANGSPDQNTQDELQQMLSNSDDSIADQLWENDGGDDIVTRMVSLLGLTNTAAPGDDTQWGETEMSAQDVITTYHYITTTLAEPGRDLILNALSNASQTAADGFDQYFGIPDGLPNVPWAIKQGWMALDSAIVLNTTGLVGPNQRYEVALLTSLPADTSWATGSKALTAGAAALASVVSG